MQKNKMKFTNCWILALSAAVVSGNASVMVISALVQMFQLCSMHVFNSYATFSSSRRLTTRIPGVFAEHSEATTKPQKTRGTMN
jgi:hypothetical protein